MIRSVLFAVLTMLSSSSAFADWTPTGFADSNEFVVYNDPDRLRQNGRFANMWELYDYLSPAHDANGKNPYLSAVRLTEFDCRAETSRIRSVTLYSGNMASGTVVANADGTGDWQELGPGTLGRHAWEIACRKTRSAKPKVKPANGRTAKKR